VCTHSTVHRAHYGFFDCTPSQGFHFELYDDYPLLEFDCLAGTSSKGALSILNMLGWSCNESADKLKEFSGCFDALGVSFVLQDGGSVGPVVKNKPGRTAELVAIIKEVIAANCLSPAAAASLRGKLQFAESQIFGRIAGHAMSLLSARCVDGGTDRSLSAELLQALSWMAQRLVVGMPRCIRLPADQSTILIFTDASVENGSSACGGVFHDPSSNNKQFFCRSSSTRFVQ